MCDVECVTVGALLGEYAVTLPMLAVGDTAGVAVNDGKRITPFSAALALLLLFASVSPL